MGQGRLTNRQVERLLDQLLDTVPRVCTDIGFARRTCILHSRIAVDALRRHGVRARALAARVQIANDTWSIGIGYGLSSGPAGYDGHVIVVANDRHVLDLTLDQASRPAKGIHLQPHRFEATAAFLAGDEPIGFTTAPGRSPLTTYVVYEALPEERGFLTVPDWLMPADAGRVDPRPRVLAELAA